MFGGHAYCRRLLAQVMPQVRELVPPEQVEAAWAWRSGRRQVEFHGPGGFFWHGQGCCRWYARAEGWQAYLRSVGDER